MCAPPRDSYEGAVEAVGAVLGAVDAVGAVFGAIDAIGAVLGATDAIGAADAIDAIDAEPPAAA